MSESKTKSNQFYSLARINKLQAAYNLIIGERSNGKTYACLSLAITNYVRSHKQAAYIRRWKEDFRGKRVQWFHLPYHQRRIRPCSLLFQ